MCDFGDATLIGIGHCSPREDSRVLLGDSSVRIEDSGVLDKMLFSVNVFRMYRFRLRFMQYLRAFRGWMRIET